jgi:primosomal protein N' (replication factor Y)
VVSTLGSPPAQVPDGEVLLEVAVALPLADVFTYRDSRGGAPPALGSQVVVPFGRRTVTGFVVGHCQGDARGAGKEVREILEVVGAGPALDESVLELCRWASSYYLAPLGEVLSAALPSGARASASRRVRLTSAGLAAVANGNPSGLAAMALDAGDRAFLARLKKARTLSLTGIARASSADPSRVNFLVERGFVEIADTVRGAKRRRVAPDESAKAGIDQPEQLPTLNPCQQDALSALLGALGQGYATFVLQGITGSGKTEVYLRIIAEAAEARARCAGAGARDRADATACRPLSRSLWRRRRRLHSGLPAGERAAAWRRLRQGEVKIAVGARSAVFAPVRDLAVVVVDEEHDGSFKQEDGFRYNARDLGGHARKSRSCDCHPGLGDAVPGNLSQRLARPLHATASARSREPRSGRAAACLPSRSSIFAAPAWARWAAFAAAGPGRGSSAGSGRADHSVSQPARVFYLRPLHSVRARPALQRLRGLAHLAPGARSLLCHYCGRAEPVRDTCPVCKAKSLEGMGSGTERVETLVRQRFPQARVARLDRDSAVSGRGQLEAFLDRVHRREIDILVGTQMVTKGHDFGGVTLVGVLQPDQGIHLPDFRAAERAFQVMEQVAGRAGRGESPGRILVQTYSPDHPAIRFLQHHDYEGFVQDELARREEAQYPPYARMVVLRLDGTDAAAVREAASAAASRARSVADSAVRVLGPSEAPIARLRGRARFQVWLSSSDRGKLLTVTRATQRVSLPRGVRLEVDVDPQSVL